MNPYEAARERLERAHRSQKAAVQALREADQEWDAADRDLAQYESAPGIPLPGYRELAQAAGTEKS